MVLDRNSGTGGGPLPGASRLEADGERLLACWWVFRRDRHPTPFVVRRAPEVDHSPTPLPLTPRPEPGAWRGGGAGKTFHRSML